ncbi:MAG: alpha/beta fold hydrolase, partial [Anaerolineae bacterium]|nr:alpha/beta fold hydrolase [Anaerolineae bacterium]
MAFLDMPLEELEQYRPARNEPADFDSFWARSLEEARAHPLNFSASSVDYGLTVIDAYDVTYNGYAGQPIKGWLLLPKSRSGKLPCIVQYIGYGGGRGLPYEWLTWANLGYATLIMDTRGQGSAWRMGNTPDFEPDGSSPQYPGFMTRGILSPDTYYYRRVMVDAVRAVEAARAHEAIDPAKIIVTGGSQGGGLTLAVAGLVDDLIGVMPEVPFLCHYRRATHLIDTFPHGEITRYLHVHRDRIEAVFGTL